MIDKKYTFVIVSKQAAFNKQTLHEIYNKMSIDAI